MYFKRSIFDLYRLHYIVVTCRYFYANHQFIVKLFYLYITPNLFTKHKFVTSYMCPWLILEGTGCWRSKKPPPPLSAA